MSRIAPMSAVRQREPRVRDKAYLGFVAKLPCIACAVRGVRTWPVEVAHIKCGVPEAGWRAFGASEKSHDARTAPLCRTCHREGPNAQHANRGGSERDWWNSLGIFPPDFCDALRQAYDAGEDGRSVVAEFARSARR